MLNQQQQVALLQIKAFLQNRDGPACFLLKGYAGTGKTFLIKALYEYVLGQEQQVVLLAPTGRAARVIAQRTGRVASTIHSRIYGIEKFLEEVIQEQDGCTVKTYKLVFKLLENMADGETVFIVDEASMVGNVENSSEFIRFGSGKLLADFVAYARLKVPGLRNRIIFVGDPAQLPPVGMTTSPALDAEYLLREFGESARECELTQVMRQEHGLILQNALRIREMIGSYKMRHFVMQADGESVHDVSGADALHAAFSADGTAYRRNTVFVTYSNAAALTFNQRIRERRWGCADVPVQADDVLMVVRNSYKYQLCNGDFCLVKDAGAQPELRKVPNVEVELRFRNVVVKYYNSEGRPVQVACKILENALDQDATTLAPEIARALYADFCVRHPGLSPRKRPREFATALQDDCYFNALLVKYGYAVTCHKAQGGEWARAIVHAGKGGQTNDDWLRWCYTAVTRAQEELFVINLPCVRQEMSQSSADANATDQGLVLEGVSEASVDFPEEYPFLRGRFRGYAAVLAESGFVIQHVEHVPAKYYVRYTVGKGEKHVCVHCLFNKNGVFKNPFRIDSGTNAPELFDAAAEALLHAPELKDVEIAPFPFEYPFLEQRLFPDLQACLRKHNAEVVVVRHFPYAEQYEVRRGLEACCFNIMYNGRSQLRGIAMQSHGCTSDAFAQEVTTWLKEARLA